MHGVIGCATGSNPPIPITTTDSHPLHHRWLQSRFVINPDVRPAASWRLSIPAVVLSFGKNGWGAINSNTPIGASGVPQASPTSADELENTNGDKNYVSHAPTEGEHTPTEFDDVVDLASHDLSGLPGLPVRWLPLIQPAFALSAILTAPGRFSSITSS